MQGSCQVVPMGPLAQALHVSSAATAVRLALARRIATLPALQMEDTIMRNAHRLGGPAIAATLAFTVALFGCSTGESRNAPEGEQMESAAQDAVEAPAPVVPAGTSMTFNVDRTVSTDDASPGDTFTATLTSDILGSDGSVLVPAGSQSRWTVTQATSNGGEDNQALLAFKLESVHVNGEWVPVQAEVTNTDIQASAQDSKTESAAKVAVGAAAGAIIGQIIGKDTESTLKGAGVGAAVGTVVALTTRGGKATLPEGSTITVRLDEGLTVPS